MARNFKSVDVLFDNPLGNKVWKSVYNDLYEEEKAYENPVRISIGFLDLQHKHEGVNPDGSDFIFTRSKVDDKCEFCQNGETENKVYLRGHLVHKAFTRVPMNVRTSVEVDEMTEKSMIATKKADAESIIEELADDLEEKSNYDEMLTIKASGETDYVDYANKVSSAFSKKFSPPPQPVLYVSGVTNKNVTVVEYNPTEDYPSENKIYKVGYKEGEDGNFTFDKRSVGLRWLMA